MSWLVVFRNLARRVRKTATSPAVFPVATSASQQEFQPNYALESSSGLFLFPRFPKHMIILLWSHLKFLFLCNFCAYCWIKLSCICLVFHVSSSFCYSSSLIGLQFYKVAALLIPVTVWVWRWTGHCILWKWCFKYLMCIDLLIDRVYNPNEWSGGGWWLQVWCRMLGLLQNYLYGLLHGASFATMGVRPCLVSLCILLVNWKTNIHSN